MAAAKKQKRFYWLVRDSLAKRMFIGRVGSRRRRRYDNNTFADHPMIQGIDPHDEFFNDPRDKHPGYPIPQPSTIFTKLPPNLRSYLVHVPVSNHNPWGYDDTTTPTLTTSTKLSKSREGSKDTTSFIPVLKPARVITSSTKLDGVIPTGDFAMTRVDRKVKKDLLRRVDEFHGDLVRGDVYRRLRKLEDAIVEWFFGVDDAFGCDGDGDGDEFVDSLEIVGSLDSVLTGLSLDEGEECEGESSVCVEQELKRGGLSGDENSHEDNNNNDEDDGWVRVGDNGDDSAVEGESWVEVKADEKTLFEPMRIHVQDKTLRLLVHTLCRYYGLNSKSEDDSTSGLRITTITLPKAWQMALSEILTTMDNEEEPTVVDQQRRRDEHDDSDDGEIVVVGELEEDVVTSQQGKFERGRGKERVQVEMPWKIPDLSFV
ncbi:hypothetical protein HDU76_004015, partial [Blyttiomyces sp. JEL0837]